MKLHRFIVFIVSLSTILWAAPVFADSCQSGSDRTCIANAIIADALATPEVSWRDQILRDVSASLTHDKRIDDAVALVAKVTNPDTKAMTIRTIGMTAALYGKLTPEELKAAFEKLAGAAANIEHPDARAIAYTYIAMAQAFAGLDADAWATAAAMTNPALKHKAYGETAEIQAERGDLAAAMKSIGFIDTASFRNKAYQKVSEILTKKGLYDEALKSTAAIDNPTKRAQALQGLLKAQEEKTKGVRRDAAPDGDKTETAKP
ncbi:MAG: hypothetical protein EBQ96_04340 [Proteobacteria bacterium]|nr:hypothetical protein [Pseudomonadota bacterium]